MDPLSSLPSSFDLADVGETMPILIPALMGLVVLMADIYLKGRNKVPLALMTAMGALLAAIAALAAWRGDTESVVLGGALATSSLTFALAIPILAGLAFIGMVHAHHGEGTEDPETGNTRSLAHGEFYALMLFGTSGMLALVAANDLVTFFVAIETLSLAVYGLTGVDRRQPRSAEGAMKYFILGAFSSGFLLYGMSLIYGGAHSLRLDHIAQAAIAEGSLPLAATGGMLLLTGLLFKVGAVPFHAWTPDAYQGAPNAATGFMSIGVKVAAFAAAVRVVIALGQCGALGSAGIWVLWFVAAITVIAGNAGALTQTNPRRLLAYSGIAHSGYLLVGVVAVLRHYDVNSPGQAVDLLLAGKDAVAGMLYYFIAYALANVGAFAVLSHLERQGEDVNDIASLGGLARTHPGSAVVMTLSLVSLAGIPGTAGFLGKLWVFRAGVAAGEIGLVVLALIASAISLYYYLNVVVVMYMREPVAGTAGALSPDPSRWCSRLSVGVAGVLTVYLGVLPNWPWPLLELMVDGAEALL